MMVKATLFLAGFVVGSFLDPVVTRLVDRKYPKVETQARKEQRGGHEDEYVSIPTNSFRRGR